MLEVENTETAFKKSLSIPLCLSHDRKKMKGENDEIGSDEKGT